MVNVSVIIPTIRAKPEMLATARQLAEQTDGVLEVIVPEGGTFAENCNQGAVNATGDILIFLNDDTEPQDGWLLPLIDPIIRDHTVGITGSKLVYPDGTIQHAGVYLTMENDLLTARNVCWNAASGVVSAVTGACMAIRHDLFDALGGFDVAYRNGYEDIDLCLKAAHAPAQIVYVAESVVIHHESQSGPARWANVSDNIRLLQQRWVGDGNSPAVPDPVDF